MSYPETNSRSGVDKTRAKRKIDKKLGKKRRRTGEIDRSNELVFFVRAGYDQRPAGSTRDTGVVGG